MSTSPLLIQNETAYDGRIIGGIVRWVFKQLDLDGQNVIVKIKYHRGKHYAYRGHIYYDARYNRGYIFARRGGLWEERVIRPSTPNEYRTLIVLRIGTSEIYPLYAHVYPRKRTHMPEPWECADWREALVSVAAHEAMHLRQYLTKPRKHGQRNEQETEWAAFRLWRRWREERRPAHQRDCVRTRMM